MIDSISIWHYAVLLAIGYGIGSLHAAYFVGKIFAKIDIREHGSGNSGGLNVVRVMGTKAGLPVVIFDVSKVILIMMLTNYIFYGRVIGLENNQLLPGMVAGFGAVLGHVFPPYLKFRGGKGIAPALGLAFMLDWRIALACVVVWAALVLTTKYVTVGGVSGLIVLSAGAIWLFHSQPAIVAICCAITVLGIIKHKDSIINVARGKEMKITERKKGGELPK